MQDYANIMADREEIMRRFGEKGCERVNERVKLHKCLVAVSVCVTKPSTGCLRFKSIL